MIQTSTRGQQRRIARKRAYAMAQPQINETHPLGNRATRRYQAKRERGIMMEMRKAGFQRHLKNLQEAAVRGYKMRMERIVAKRAK